MTYESYIKFLQEVLTMVDNTDPHSIAHAKSLLQVLKGFVASSGMISPLTERIMNMSIAKFDYLAAHKHDFAGVPGDFNNNQRKRDRLAAVLQPAC